MSREYEGTGLGLALVRHLAEAHGGSVGVASRSNEGSRFSITLPWEVAPPAEAPDPTPAPNGMPASAPPETSRIEPLPSGTLKAVSDTPRPTILLVEDHQSNVIVISEMLESHGYRVLVANSGSEGLTRAYDEQPALILMDIQLPGMSGLAAIQRLRVDTRTSAIPIIALTALVLPGDRERCLDAGASAYLAKPVSMRTLLERIDDLVKRRKF